MDIATELRELARNVWWSWQPNVIAIFRDLDPDLWRRMNHNPVAFLAEMPPDALNRRASELAIEARVSHAFHRLHDYQDRRRNWGDVHAGPLRANPVAYFSAEFGLHESIPVYSGGLGILAGDTLKAASDLGLPMVGVGLLYAQGYFNQRLESSGWQKEHYFDTPFEKLPMDVVMNAEGKPLRVRVETLDGKISAGVWKIPVGSATLLLLDSDVKENSAADRQLTSRLYGGDNQTRIRQELLMGVGGIRALTAIGIRPGVLHLNEGHSAFALLELARQEMVADGIAFEEAFRRVRSRSVFTTHTPVEAGHDRFDAALMDATLGPLSKELGISSEELMGIGRVKPKAADESFCMTVLGLKGAARANAVAAIHGRVSRRMWHGLWPDREEDEVPIDHITNGIHVSSWVATPMRQIFDTYLGHDWEPNMNLPETWEAIHSVDDDELWEAHQTLKTRLVSYVQRQVCDQETRRQENGEACDMTRKRLDPSILTLGFARRFATYKRGNLVLSDDERLERLICDKDRPVQIVFAGKAHPHDDPGKHLIQRIFRMTRDPRFLGRIVFLEDYDISVGRHLVQGVDVWLNTPRRPREACGTSGMKAVFNATLNLSVLDGWWAEAYDGRNGFAIGEGRQHVKEEEQDKRDAHALYDVLESQVIPLYYTRDDEGIPVGWVECVKHAIQSLAWRFSARRMVGEYARKCYLPAVGTSSEAL